jgi:tRNA(adenine34) deaminase
MLKTGHPLQSSVKTASDSRRQIDQRSEVNQQLASFTESS